MSRLVALLWKVQQRFSERVSLRRRVVGASETESGEGLRVRGHRDLSFRTVAEVLQKSVFTVNDTLDSLTH